MSRAADAPSAAGARPGRFLVAMVQGGGNIPLIVPVLARLAARGHDVRVIPGPGVRPSRMPVSDRMLERIANAGARIIPFTEPTVHPLEAAPAIEGLARAAIPEAFRAQIVARTIPVWWSETWAENVSAELRREGADVVVADFVLLGAMAAAEAAGVPAATLVHNASVAFVHVACRRPVATLPPCGLGFMPAGSAAEAAEMARVRAVIRRIHERNARVALNQVRDRLGLPPLRAHCDQFDAAARVLILAPESFDFPTRRLPVNVRYTGTPIDDADAVAWRSPWPADDPRPLVLVSLSTLEQGQGDLMRRILTAVGSLPVRTLATLGPTLASRPLDAPENVRLEPFVPHSAVLPQVTAMVIQCGLGTLMKALTHGVPLVCLPMLGDQPDNAARVVYHGAGVRLGQDASSDDISTALRQVLSEPGFAAAARQLASNVAGVNAATRAAVELETLVAHDPR